MDSNSKNGFFQKFLSDAYEKKTKVDVVELKRKHFNTLLEEAHNELRNKLYITAAKNYFVILEHILDDPHSDELGLSQEANYAIKCCFCYSVLSIPDPFNDKDQADRLLKVVSDLNDEYKTRVFPLFLLILTNFYKKRWLKTLTWCNDIMAFVGEGKKMEQSTDFFRELLPGISEIRCEVQTCEEIAFFGYGEMLMKDSLYKPRFDKYKNWANKLEGFIVNNIAKFGPSISDLELHTIFHQEVFPLWCLANDKDVNCFYSDKFINDCTECFYAKLRTGIKKANTVLTENPSEEQIRFEKYVSQCAEFYRKFTPSSEIHNSMENHPGSSVKKTPKKSHNISTQTEKLKTNSKRNQTDGTKTKNVEVQVGSESEVLTAILEVKNKCLLMQSKKDETILKLNRKIADLQDTINKNATVKKSAENEFEKQIANFQFEIQKLKEQITAFERVHKIDNEKNISLQKLLVEHNNEKYNIYKKQYKTFERQAQFMVAFLGDLFTYLTPKSVPNNITCVQNIEKWQNYLQIVQGKLVELDNFYRDAREDMINTDIFVIWPELPEFPKLEDNMVFINFKLAIRNIIQAEERFNWKQNAERQSQIARANLGTINNMSYNFPRPLFPPQLNQGLLYANVAAAQMAGPYPPLLPTPKNPLQIPPYLADPGVSYMAPISCLHHQEPNPLPNRPNGLINIVNQAEGAAAANFDPSPNQMDPKGNASTSKLNKENDMIIFDYVLEKCSGATEGEVTIALLSLLDQNQGTLSNISKDRIVEECKAVLRLKKQSAWVTPKSPHVDWKNDHTENDCAICFEELSMHEKYTLPCQHEYHKECIKKWLKTSSVCPICRLHSVIDEDFPPLH